MVAPPCVLPCVLPVLGYSSIKTPESDASPGPARSDRLSRSTVAIPQSHSYTATMHGQLTGDCVTLRCIAAAGGTW